MSMTRVPQFSPITSWVPSAAYLEALFINSRETQLPGASHSRQEYQRLRMSMVTGEYLRNDDNFKLPKAIRGAQGAQPYTAMNTTMNEHGEIVARYLKTDSSLSGIIGPLQLVAKRAGYSAERVRCHACMAMGDVKASLGLLQQTSGRPSH